MDASSADKLFQSLMRDGYYSEYLPPCFSIENAYDKHLKSNPPCESKANIEPLMFNMSRFTSDNARRCIYIPELSSYVSAMHFIKENSILQRLLEVATASENSFSHLINKEGTVARHEDNYNKSPDIDVRSEGIDENASNYIDNVIAKIKKSQGSSAILHIDIAHYYQSIYTHIIPSIILGLDKSLMMHNVSKADSDAKLRVANQAEWDEFELMQRFDVKIRSMNGSRTNGILTGPQISKFIAEALLSVIDRELAANSLKFSRYMDDYEFYVYDKSQVGKMLNQIEKIFARYYLHINHEKTKVEDYPLFVTENLEAIYKQFADRDVLSDAQTMAMFNKFAQLESSGTKGATRYLIKSIDEHMLCEDSSLYLSFLFNVLANDNRALVKVCQLILSQKERLSLDQDHGKLLLCLLKRHIHRNNELETIWILYLLCKISKDSISADLIDLVIESGNDLAKAIVINECKTLLTEGAINAIKSSQVSWFLAYELYYREYLDEIEFGKMCVTAPILKYYQKLKKKKVHLYKRV